MLTGGHPNSLGRAEEVVGLVLADQSQLAELFKCLDSSDEVVRLRAGDALEKVCRRNPEWFQPYVYHLLNVVGAINQPSVQWHVAQMLVKIKLTADEQQRSVSWLWRTFNRTTDWIVISETLTALSHFAKTNPAMRNRLITALKKTQQDPRQAVAKRATKLLSEL